MKNLKLNTKESRYKGFKVGQGVQFTYFTKDDLEVIRVAFLTLGNVRTKLQRAIKKKPVLDWYNNIVKEGSVDYYKTLLNKTKKELEEEKGV